MKGFIFVGLALLLVAACTLEQRAVPIITDSNVPAVMQPVKTNVTTTVQKANTTATVKAPTIPPANFTTAAVLLTNQNCVETDDRDDQYVKGTLQLVQPNGTLYKVDECLGTSLREWYCDRGELQKQIVECRNGCFDGACKQQ